MSLPPVKDSFVLYGCWRSSACHRLQIGLRLKELPFLYRPVNLDAAEQHSVAYRAINPRGELPTLVVNGEPWYQSLSILEQIEAEYPARGVRLLPSEARAQRHCRELSEAINSSLQPLLLPARLRRPILEAAPEAQRSTLEQAMATGILAHQSEALRHLECWLAQREGPFCLGEEPSLADVLLVPHLDALLRLGVDLNPCPRLRAVHQACLSLEAFASASPERLPDAPAPSGSADPEMAMRQRALAHKEPAAALFTYLSGVANPAIPGLDRCRRQTLERFPLVASKMTALEVCLLLRWLCRSRGVSRALEIGVFTGSSSLALLDGLPPSGRLVAIDRDAEVAALADTCWRQIGQRQRVEFQLGDALELMGALEPGFDLIYIDAENKEYGRYLELALPLLAERGLLVFDNVLWRGRVCEPDGDVNAEALDAFNRRLRERSDLHSTVLSCGDGVALVERDQSWAEVLLR